MKINKKDEAKANRRIIEQSRAVSLHDIALQVNDVSNNLPPVDEEYLLRAMAARIAVDLSGLSIRQMKIVLEMTEKCISDSVLISDEAMVWVVSAFLFEPSK